MGLEPSDAIGEEELQALASPEAEQSTAGMDIPGWLEPLLSTDPRISIGEIQAEHDCSRGEAHLIRAGMKAAGTDGMPAIIDAVFGIVLISQSAQTANTDEETADVGPPSDADRDYGGLTEEELETGTRIT